MDFYQIKERETKKDTLEVYPDFKVMRSKDLMIRAKSFYGIYDKETGLWSTDEYDVQRLVDAEIREHQLYTPRAELYSIVHRKFLGDFSTNSWLQFRNYIGHLTDNSTSLDEHLTFANTPVKKEDYVSKRLPYALSPGDISAYEEMFGTLFAPEEKQKLEWAIGAIISGDAKYIQKFIVIEGAAGTGKSTWIELLQLLTEGYYKTVNLKELTSANNMFAMEAFRTNPLVAIEHDTDLSKIVDNTKLNSIVAHEAMQINEKNKPSYMMRFNAFLIAGSNSPVKFTDSKSGLIRRLIDVHPTGNTLAPRKYQALKTQIEFELGAIAQHCLDVYQSMGKDYYSGYRAINMILQTDVFFNYIEAHYDIFRDNDGTTLKQAFDLWKIFKADSEVEWKMPIHRFREELKSYFRNFEERTEVNGQRVRSWYSGFNADRFKVQLKEEEPKVFSLVLDYHDSLLDERYADMTAQYSNENGGPKLYWSDKPVLRENRKTGKMEEYIPKPSEIAKTQLKDLDTTKEHYVNTPENEIVIDFDIRDSDGNKSVEMNLEAASKWPPTYAEFSKSEAGIHLHYDYTGDVSELSRFYDHGIEIKIFNGNSALRRKLSKCNNIPVAKISSGLPLKEKKMMNSEGVKSERGLRDLIERNLRKEIHPGTKSSVDFIHHVLQEAYDQGLVYDVTDMRNAILSFAAKSTNQSLAAIRMVNTMKFASEVPATDVATDGPDEAPEIIYDVEVFPNLFVVCWKGRGDKTVVRMINPTPQEIEELFNYRLIGFNNRRYDNHILYARSLGFTNEQLYKLSKKIIENSKNALFGAAYNLSYTDIYDFASAANKKGLKKWQIELDLNHSELGLPWDEPVDEELWQTVADYCANDVITTEAVFDHLHQDFKARQILAALSGLTVNDTTNKHSTRIMFGDEKRPQEEFVYTNLADMFPGYVFERGKSTYRGEITGEGGYVYAEPGMYTDVDEYDVSSMHPTSIEQLDLFGAYTPRFSEIKQARVMIKHGDYETASQMLEGKLAPFLQGDDVDPKGLSDALKTVINSVYGLTSASFENSFRDPRNIDNIVAKRGALFMIDLKNEVQKQGYQVVHIKTDSIKVANADDKIGQFIMDFGQQYGYDFEHEGRYERFCLVNDAVYIAKTADGKTPSHWTATGAQFAHPYVFKKLFSKEKIQFKDKCEAKSVTTSLYIDFREEDEAMALQDDKGLKFIGKTGNFCPILPGEGGGLLVREKDGKFYAATGSKGYTWMEADVVKSLGKEKSIDLSYFDKLVEAAIENISQYGNFDWFVDND